MIAIPLLGNATAFCPIFVHDPEILLARKFLHFFICHHMPVFKVFDVSVSRFSPAEIRFF